MIRKTFDQGLRRLDNDVLVLGAKVEIALQQSVGIFKQGDVEGARILIAEDRRIDEKRYAIESDTLEYIATQQPMASDLRTLAAVLIIANELERIGDYAKGIGRITLRLSQVPVVYPLVDISTMDRLSRKMLHISLQAFIRRDAEIVSEVLRLDDEVDRLYEKIYYELQTLIIEDGGTLEQASHLLFVAHKLERAADRATNICERVIYCVTGDLVDTDRHEKGIAAVA